MGSLATFNTTYVSSTVLPIGQRMQLAGATQAIGLQFGRGAAGATALANVNNARMGRVVLKAQRLSAPYQATLASDFFAIDAA